MVQNLISEMKRLEADLKSLKKKQLAALQDTLDLASIGLETVSLTQTSGMLSIFLVSLCKKKLSLEKNDAWVKSADYFFFFFCCPSSHILCF